MLRTNKKEWSQNIIFLKLKSNTNNTTMQATLIYEADEIIHSNTLTCIFLNQ